MSTTLHLPPVGSEQPVRPRRDTWRVVAVVVAVLALVAATVAIVIAVNRDDTPAPRPSASASPSPSAGPSVTPTPVVVDPNEPIGAAWPLTTAGEVAAWRANQAAYPYLTGAASTVRAFATTYLGISDASVRRTPSGTYEVARPDPNGRPTVVTRVVVEAVDGRAPYVVRSAAKPEELDVAVPAEGSTVSSPLAARGTYRAVDPSIRVEVRAAGTPTGVTLGSARATYSPAGWAATVSFVPSARRTGAVVVTNGSLTGPGIAAALVVPVAIGKGTPPAPPPPPVPAPPATFAGVDPATSRVALYRTADGARLRFLTAPATGADGDSLPVLTADRTRVRFSRGMAGTAALMEVRTDGTGLRTLVLRSSGPVLAGVDTARGLAYVGRDKATGRHDVVLRGASGDTRLGLFGFVQPRVTASRDGRFVYLLTGDSPNGPLSLRRIDVTRRVGDVVVGPSAGCSWQTLTAGYLANGARSVLAAQYCGTGGARRSSVVVMDEGLGAVRRLLTVGTAAVSRLATDATGRHVLLWRTDTGDVHLVQRWISGAVLQVARGVAEPAW
ncbi:MAG TPA: hypothetical protein VNQ77_05165 [Frankiaceae bacterium]|nr:hypothetical protein [Frankiaceae bacterium]